MRPADAPVVLVPVLDDDKYYWVGQDEVEKLLRHDGDWLASHPERELIAHRYLKHQKYLARAALARLLDEDQVDPDAEQEQRAVEEEVVEAPIRLNDRRMDAVLAVLKEQEARRMLDLGCGSGQLLRRLLADKSFEQIVGLDVSLRTLEQADERLHLDRLPERKRGRIQLLHGSLIYRDKRLQGFDAAAVVEVVEHMDPARLTAFERVLFEFATRGRTWGFRILVAPSLPQVGADQGYRPDGRHALWRFDPPMSRQPALSAAGPDLAGM